MNKNETNKAELRDVSAQELRTVEGGGILRDVINSVIKVVNEVNLCKGKCKIA